MKFKNSWLRFAVLSAAVVILIPMLAMVARSPRKEMSGTQTSAANTGSHTANAAEKSKTLNAFGRLPLSFEENQGQSAQEVRYLSHGSGYELFLTSQEAVLALKSPSNRDFSPRHRIATLKKMREERAAKTSPVLRVQLMKANPAPGIAGADKLPGVVNYFTGNDQKNWHSNIPTYEKVKYSQVYPGVDLVFYGNQRRLEYDFIVAPGADPNAIALNIAGSRKVSVAANGDLLMGVNGGNVKLQKPVIYQNVAGKRQEVAGGFRLTGAHQVKFAVGKYDRSAPLILDPVVNYDVYLGGSGDDEGIAIALDSTNQAYIAGQTTSTDFPTTTTATNPNVAGGTAAFLTKLSADGQTRLYSTYIAGLVAPGEIAFALAVDTNSVAYVTGSTTSTDFPTTSTAVFPGPNASAGNGTGFLVKLDTTKAGSASLIYSSYVGGDFGDVGNAVALTDASGIIYIAGYTATGAGTFSLNGFQTALSTISGNAFIAKVDTTQSGVAGILYASYLGGNDANVAALGFGDAAFGLTADANGNAYVVGDTSSTDLAAGFAKGYKTTYPSGANPTVFVAKVDTAQHGSLSAAYLTYLGGTGADFGDAIALGPTSLAYVTGQANSTNFPTTPNSYSAAGAASGKAYLSVLDTTMSSTASLIYSTVFGGTNGDEGLALKVDPAGIAYIGGKTQSTDFPVTPGSLLPTFPAGASGVGFITKLAPAGTGSADLVYSTYFGGSGDGNTADIDQVEGIAIDSSTALINIYATGHTYSTNLPGVTNTSLGLPDAFAVKLTPELTLSITGSLEFNPQALNVASAPLALTLTNNSGAAIPFTSATITGSSTFVVTNGCGTSIAAGASCMVSVVFTPTALGAVTGTLTLIDGDSTSPQVFAISGTGVAQPPDFTITVAPTAVTVAQGASGTATVTVSPIAGLNTAVTLSCSGLPAKSTCAFNPATVTSADGTAAATSVVTITTTANTALVVPMSKPTTPFTALRILPLFIALMALLALLRTQKLATRLGLAGAMAMCILLAGCSGTGSSHNNGTPKGTSTVTITGTATVSGAPVTHSATLTLTVD